MLVKNKGGEARKVTLANDALIKLLNQQGGYIADEIIIHKEAFRP